MEKNISVVKYIICLANELNFNVVAEGIETKEQLEYLKSVNCKIGQGYYIARPMCMDDINDLLYENKGLMDYVALDKD